MQLRGVKKLFPDKDRIWDIFQAHFIPWKILYKRCSLAQNWSFKHIISRTDASILNSFLKGLKFL